jgi:hypothetical protein
MEEYRFKNSWICTSNGVIQEEEKYQYKEGSYIKDVQLLSVIEDGEWWQFKLLFLEDSRVNTVSFHKDAQNIGFMGMWRLYDQDTFDIEKAGNYKRELAEKSKNAKFTRLDINFDEL